MPQTTPAKKKRRPTPRPADKPLPAVLTLPEVARFLRLSARQVETLAKEQGLPGRQIGAEWHFLRTAVENWLARDTASRKSVLGQAGVWADDPDFEQFQNQLRQIRKEANQVA
jgi:excisionase family DNA binding protein